MRKKYKKDKICNCPKQESDSLFSLCCGCKREACELFDESDMCLMKKYIEDLEKENKKLKRAGRILLE